MLPHFSSRRVKAELTRPIIVKWVDAFETLLNVSGQLYPVFEEAIPAMQLDDFCARVRDKLGLGDLAVPAGVAQPGQGIARVEAFARVVAWFPELAHTRPTVTPFRDYEVAQDDCWRATVLLRSLDIISSVYRTRDIDPKRKLNYFEAAKILTRIAHILRGEPKRRRLFLAHASADKDVVLSMRAALQARGFECIYDEADITLGAGLKETIRRELGEPQTSTVVFWSAEAARSEWVRFELEVALGMAAEPRRGIMVLRLDNTEPPPSANGMRFSEFLYCRSRLEYERMCDLDKNCEEIYFAMVNAGR